MFVFVFVEGTNTKQTCFPPKIVFLNERVLGGEKTKQTWKKTKKNIC